MKKFFAILLTLALAAALLAGCAAADKPQPTPGEGENEQPGEMPEQSSNALKTGLYIMGSLDGSTGAGEEEGVAKSAATVVALTLDADGRIDSMVLDQIQSSVSFNGSGAITGDTAAELIGKREQGADYGLAGASSIGKEWNEQADAFSAYCVGKTVDEVMGIAFDEGGKPSDADLASSVTLSFQYVTYAVKAAADSAAELGAVKGDKLGLAVNGNAAKSYDATSDKDGLIQGYFNFAAVTVNDEGRVTSAIFDGLQANVNFAADGSITSDLAAAPVSKNVLMDDYGLKGSSSIGKEWYEQAAAFATYISGMTADEIEGVAVDENMKATDADLASSVTVSVGGFMNLAARAVRTAA